MCCGQMWLFHLRKSKKHCAKSKSKKCHLWVYSAIVECPFVRGSLGSEIEILIYKTETVPTVLKFTRNRTS